MNLTEKTVKELKNFVNTMSIVLITLATFSWWRGRMITVSFLLSFAFLLILLRLIIIKWVFPVYRIWMKFAEKLSIIMNLVILSILYYLVLTPLGLVLRLLGKDILNRTFEAESPSYWLKREDGIVDPKQMERRF